MPSRPNQQTGFRRLGWLWVVAALCLAPSPALALAPGDIAIIGYHGNGATTSGSSGDAFAWTPLIDLPAGEVIYFSDTGYYTGGANNGFGGSGGGTDGLIQFTVPADGIPFGAVQTVGSPINPTPAPYSQPSSAYLDSTGVLSSSHLNFSGSGDQLVAFQDPNPSNTAGFSPLFAVNGASSSWTSGGGGDRNQTNLYPGLTDGQNAVAVGVGPGAQDSSDNARYVGQTDGSRTELLASIADASNWERTNGVNETGNVLDWITNGVNQFTDGVTPPTLNILMIGNSYTQGNSTARATFVDLQGFFDADPTINATVVNQSVGGQTLATHADPNGDTVAELISSAGQYDVVVLQERSDRPGRAMKFGGSQLTGLNAGGPVLIEDYLKVHQPQAEVVLFNTWARHPDLEPANDDDLATYFNDDPLEMQAFTDQGYQHILIGSPEGDLSDVAEIAPVGQAWEAWYAEFGYANPTAVLHDPDGTHQGDNGAYLAAAVLFGQITGKSVAGSSYTGAVSGTLAGEQLTTLLQLQATATLGLSLPGDFNGDGAVDAADYTVWRDGLGTTYAEADYQVWADHYGQSLPSPATAVPELSGFAMTSLAAAMLAVGRRSRKRRAA